jgi:hypothetical protein
MVVLLNVGSMFGSVGALVLGTRMQNDTDFHVLVIALTTGAIT